MPTPPYSQHQQVHADYCKHRICCGLVWRLQAALMEVCASQWALCVSAIFSKFGSTQSVRICKQMAHWLWCLTVYVSHHCLVSPRLSFGIFVLIPSGLLSALACMHTRHSVNVSEFHLHSMFLVPCGSWQSRCEHLARPCHFPGVKLLSSGSLTRWWHGNDAVRALCLACPSCRAMACDEMALLQPDCWARLHKDM